MKRIVLVLAMGLAAMASAEKAKNPIIWADVPDVAMIRVGDTYYMSSTTMHMSPGLPIMKSKDLVNWELIGYAYDQLVDNDRMNLENGKSAYGAGSWASSLRFHNGTYYATTFSGTSGLTHIYTTKNIEKGDWKEQTFKPMLHDHSLFFDDDGRVYMVHGSGAIRLTELKSDLSGIKPGGVDQVIIPRAGAVVGAKERAPVRGPMGSPLVSPPPGMLTEGSQMIKKDGKYYIFNIVWPRGDMRTEVVHRADKITGPYEGRVALHDRGIAQGCLIDTPKGKWYAYMFQDNGAVGRSPWLIPVVWEDGWPVLGTDGKAPDVLHIEKTQEGIGNLAESDEFDRRSGDPKLPLAWQWNHNPDTNNWEIVPKPGRLRITTGRVDSDVTQARNTLTQRTFGPISSASTFIRISNMKDGDVAGLIALQKKYGYVGVRMENGKKAVVMTTAESPAPQAQVLIPPEETTVFLRIDCDFRDRADLAYFYYRFEGGDWMRIGKPLHMVYTLPHFMGYRFGLFNYATQTPGGYVDFDYYRVALKDSLEIEEQEMQ